MFISFTPLIEVCSSVIPTIYPFISVYFNCKSLSAKHLDPLNSLNTLRCSFGQRQIHICKENKNVNKLISLSYSRNVQQTLHFKDVWGSTSSLYIFVLLLHICPASKCISLKLLKAFTLLLLTVINIFLLLRKKICIKLQFIQAVLRFTVSLQGVIRKSHLTTTFRLHFSWQKRNVWAPLDVCSGSPKYKWWIFLCSRRNGAISRLKFLRGEFVSPIFTFTPSKLTSYLWNNIFLKKGKIRAAQGLTLKSGPEHTHKERTERFLKNKDEFLLLQIRL